MIRGEAYLRAIELLEDPEPVIADPIGAAMVYALLANTPSEVMFEVARMKNERA